MEPLDPPPDSKAGDRVYVDGYQHDVAGGEVQCTEYGSRSLSVALCPLQKSIRGWGIDGQKMKTNAFAILTEPDAVLNPKKKIFDQVQVC